MTISEFGAQIQVGVLSVWDLWRTLKVHLQSQTETSVLFCFHSYGGATDSVFTRAESINAWAQPPSSDWTLFLTCQGGS